VKIKTYIKSLFKKSAPKSKEGFLYLSDNIRKIKGEELNNIKLTIQNYVGDDVLSRLITSKANQIKEEGIQKCHNIIETANSVEEAGKKAGLIMLGVSFKLKGLEELVDEIKFFAKKEPQASNQQTDPHAHI